MSSQAVICDIGTFNTRVGLAGEAVPSFFVKTRGSAAETSAVWKSRVYDYQAFEFKVNDSKLLDNPADVDMLVIESVTEPDSLHFRKNVCESFLEKKGVRSINFQYAPVVTCFANARQTGLVLDMSAGGCTASAVLDGWCLNQTNVERSELGGEQLDEWLHGKAKNGPTVTKEGFNALQKTRASRESQTFKLPDSTPISQKVSDVLFDPTSLHDTMNYVPLHELAFTAATKQTSNEVRRALINNVIICGGLSRTEGVQLRLVNELNAMARLDNPRIIASGPQHRDVVGWIGGSILASLPVFKELSVTQAEYKEGGIDVVFKKCA